MDKLLIGTVKWFNNDKGYGFIVYRYKGKKKEVFVHHTQIMMDGYRTLKEGEIVEFEILTTSKGAQAVCVCRV